MELTLNQIIKQLVTPKNILPQFHPWVYIASSIIFRTCDVHRWVRINGFCSPAARITPSGTMGASHQGKSFQISTNFISPSLTTKVCGVFRNSVLPSSSGGKLRAMKIAYIILNFLRRPLPIARGEIFYTQDWDFYNLWLLEGVSSFLLIITTLDLHVLKYPSTLFSGLFFLLCFFFWSFHLILWH